MSSLTFKQSLRQFLGDEGKETLTKWPRARSAGHACEGKSVDMKRGFSSRGWQSGCSIAGVFYKTLSMWSATAAP